MQETIAFLDTLADEAGAIIRRYFRQAYATDTKAKHDPVTEADRAVETALRRLILNRYPDDTIQGEEFGITQGSSGRTWVIDPIDGTRAFAVGRATFATLIAICVDGDPVAGVIDQPILRERWVGAAGMTTYNGHPCYTAPCTDAPRMITTAPGMFTTEREIRTFDTLAEQARFITYGGDSYAYGLLASGFADLVVEAHLKPHDVMALVPVVNGAGGMLTDWQGRSPNLVNCQGQTLACGDRALHARLLDMI